MKVATRVVAVLLVLASASVASAATHVWFTAVPVAGTAALPNGGGGAQGEELILKCDSSPTAVAAACDWTVTMVFQNDAGDNPIVGWALDIFRKNQETPGKVIIVSASLAYTASPFASHPIPTSYGPDPNLIRNADGTDFTNVGSGGATLGSFTLRKIKNRNGSLNTFSIDTYEGDNAWSDNTGTSPDIQLGNAPVVPGAAPGDFLGQGIIIMNVPEPATLSLLGLGALALIRRRR